MYSTTSLSANEALGGRKEEDPFAIRPLFPPPPPPSRKKQKPGQQHKKVRPESGSDVSILLLFLSENRRLRGFSEKDQKVKLEAKNVEVNTLSHCQYIIFPD